MDNIPSTVYQMVNNMKSLYADDVAVRYYDEKEKAVQSVKYAQVYEDICRCAAFLKKELPGDRPHVAILARNCYHYIVHIFAIILADMVAIPLNFQKSPDELCYETEFADVAAIVHDGEYLEREPSFAERCGKRFISMDAFSSMFPLVPAETDDLCSLSLIVFTSGTTGKSKGVMISQNNMYSMLDGNITVLETGWKYVGKDEKVRVFTMLPMFHVGSLLEMIIMLSVGNSLNLCTDPRRFFRDISEMPSDYSALVPVMLKSIHDDVIRGRNRFGDLRFISVGAATVDPQMIHTLHEKGYYVTQGYGMTEAIGTGIYNDMQGICHFDSIGKPTSGTEYKLADDGELCVRSKSVMLGYYKDPAATAEAIDPEGWLHTGDLARIDEDGYIFLTGRKKNLIILSSGENINPEELEDLLYKNPDIIETIVAEKDGKICACIFCPENAHEAVRNYLDGLNRTLPMYKHISTVEFRTEPFERTATGKIKRK